MTQALLTAKPGMTSTRHVVELRDVEMCYGDKGARRARNGPGEFPSTASFEKSRQSWDAFARAGSGVHQQ